MLEELRKLKKEDCKEMIFFLIFFSFIAILGPFLARKTLWLGVVETALGVLGIFNTFERIQTKYKRLQLEKERKKLNQEIWEGN